LRLSEGLRFTLANDGNAPYIRDRDHPDNGNLQIVVSAPVIGVDTGAPRAVAAYARQATHESQPSRG
jgi:hypothetical protein